MKTINLSTWKRKEHFAFFSKFDEPFWGIVSEVDCTIAYKTAKENKISFFAWYLYKSLLAANDIEEFRYRTYNGKVVLYEEIHASPTIGREDGTFGFSFVRFNQDFNVFYEDLNNEIVRVKSFTGLCMNENASRKDVIHYSSLPWAHFTGLTHARNYQINDSSPKITFGKAFYRDNVMFMSVSLNMHHGLADGFHAAKFYEKFQNHMNTNII